MKNKVQLEVCIDSVQSAINAQEGGAIRVELCDNLFEGGTTPSAGTIEVVRENIKIGLQVIIRPRGGDFLYSDLEFEIMKKDIETAKRLGADGVVIGILLPDGSIDAERVSELIKIARPMNVTFHRAFDMARDPFEAMETLIALKVDRILTSGQERSVIEGLDLIKELVQKAGDRILIMPGGGIREKNLDKIVGETGVKECHISGRMKVESKMEFVNNSAFMGGELRMPEYSMQVVDPAKIKNMLN